MKFFFKKILSFCLFTLLVIFTFTFLYYNQFQSRLTFSKNIETVILGDSHTQNGLNDNIINNSVNYSNSAEPLILTHAKLRYITDKNLSVENVIISLHSFTLSEKAYSEWLRPDNIFNSFGSLFPIFNLNDYGHFFKEFGIYGLINIFHSIIYHSIFSVEKKIINNFSPNVNNSDLWIGGYTPNNQIMNEEVKLTETTQNNINLNDFSVGKYSNFQLIYLKKIINICKKKSLNLIFINTPIYLKKNNNKIPFELLDIQEFKYIDYSMMHLDTSFFADNSHLNPKGSDTLSLLINNKINSPNFD